LEPTDLPWEVPSNYKSRKKGDQRLLELDNTGPKPPNGVWQFPIGCIHKSWTFEAPRWTMMGAPLFFPAIFFYLFISSKGDSFGFFIPSLNSTKFWCQKIEQKNPGGVPVATASFFGGKFLSFGSFSKIK
jgi:hypothetical protein